MGIARWIAVGMTLLGVAAADESGALKDEDARRSYALGAAFGKQLRAEAVKIDLDLYARGLKDALSGGDALLSEAEVRAAVHRLQTELTQNKRAKQHGTVVAAKAPPAVQVSFKLDPRVTKSLYMGERWVAGATYSSGTAPHGAPITVEARASGAGGKIAPTWTASNPEMVTVSPRQGAEVTLTVTRAGESTVTVKHGDRSSTFGLRTVAEPLGWRVTITKGEPPAPSEHVTAAGAIPEQTER